MAGPKTLLTGVRASGEVHLGNYLGAMKPAIENQTNYQSYLFVADLHGLTTNPPADDLRQATRQIAAAWLAAGLDTKRTVFWKQSDVPEVLELAYVLTCVTTMGLLERAHSYKDILAKQKSPKAGLFIYPVLMAADILLYEADLVPVGKDQMQHLEMTRDMATFFNETYQATLKLPQALVQDQVAIVPGIDGRKMSKSYDNGIEIFGDEKSLKKRVMSIVTDSKGLNDPKEAAGNTIYELYRLIAQPEAANTMKHQLEAGGYGYGDAKKKLYEVLMDTFGPMRREFQRWMSAPGDLDNELKNGAERARTQASKMIKRVKEAVGL